MKQLSNIFTLASGVFGVLPGIAVLLTNMGVPPNSSQKLFAATIEALGIMTLLLLWMNKDNIQRKTANSFNRLITVGITTFILSFFAYIFLYGYLIEDVPNSTSLFFPLWEKGELKQGLQDLGSRTELIRQWGRDDVYEVINESSKVPLLITTLILLFVYQLVFVSLSFSFGAIGIRLSKKSSNRPATRKKKADTKIVS